MAPAPGELEVGRIGHAHGLRGEVSITFVSNRPERAAPGAVLRAGDRLLVIASSRRHQGKWLVKFDGVDDRSSAEALKGTLLTAEPLTAAAPLADEAKIVVSALHVTGHTIYPEAELLALTGFKPGGELTLSELRGMARKISDHYHRHAYFVAQAYVPPQDIKDGAVTIAVIEGAYGNVTLNNQTNLSNDVAYGLLAGLNPGDPIVVSPLERRLLLLFCCFKVLVVKRV